MKFLEGIQHHDLLPFDCVCDAGNAAVTISVWPTNPLYCVGLHSRNEEGEIRLLRITSGVVDSNRIGGAVDAGFFAGGKIFPMDLGLVSREYPINVTFELGDRYRDLPVSDDVRLNPRLTDSGLSFSMTAAELQVALRRLRPPQIRLYFIGARMPLEDMRRLDDLRWCRHEIQRLREENQRMWDREWVESQVRAMQSQGSGPSNLCSPGFDALPTVEAPPRYPGNRPPSSESP